MNEERTEEIKEEIAAIRDENIALSLAIKEGAAMLAELSEGPNVSYKRNNIAELSNALDRNRRRLTILRDELNSLAGISVVSSSPVAFFTR